MTMNLTVGSDSLTLCTGDVEKHPESLLYSLLNKEAGSTDSSHVTLKVTFPPGSPCNGWRDAARVTAALYRGDHLPVELVSDLLKTSTTASPSDVAADVYDKLAALLDHLGLPGPVSKWLPPRGQITLPHVRIIDLHYVAAVDTAVSTILSSTAFSSGSISKDIGEQRAAFFCITMKGSDASTVALQVFAVGGAELCCVQAGSGGALSYTPARLLAALSAAGSALTKWFQASWLPAGIGRWMQSLHYTKLSSSVAIELPEPTDGAAKARQPVGFSTVVWGSEKGDVVSNTHRLLWPMILDRLQRGISHACFTGDSRGINVRSV